MTVGWWDSFFTFYHRQRIQTNQQSRLQVTSQSSEIVQTIQKTKRIINYYSFITRPETYIYLGSLR